MLKDPPKDKRAQFVNPVLNDNIPATKQPILRKALAHRNNLPAKSMFHRKKTQKAHPLLNQ
jgi:hypothetical protein